MPVFSPEIYTRQLSDLKYIAITDIVFFLFNMVVNHVRCNK